MLLCWIAGFANVLSGFNVNKNWPEMNYTVSSRDEGLK